MNKPQIYVTAQRLSREMIKELEGHAAGIFFGDLFCQKRMFENDWFDVAELMNFAKEKGFKTIFQTPAYNTTRTMEETISLIRKLSASSILDAVSVHDVGVVEELRGLSDVELWWDKFSFNRDIVPNVHLIDFLKSHGVSKIELVRPFQANEIINYGCETLLYVYGPDVVSFGRICYTEYFLEEACERKILCSYEKPFIASVDKVPLQYVADGYALLDKASPIHQISKLNPDLLNKLDGFTAYIRDSSEIDMLDSLSKLFSDSA
jgi:collagenase-like PrtC family protease